MVEENNEQKVKEQKKAPAEEAKDSEVQASSTNKQEPQEEAAVLDSEKKKTVSEGTDEVEQEKKAKPESKVRVRKGKKNIPNGIVYINATFNNTLVTVADTNGNTIAWSSAGSKGFKGSRKNTPFAAQIAAEDACRKAMEHGLRSVSVEVRGPGAGRESAIRAVSSCGILITMMRDTTPVPHNGCRPPKRRRV